MGDESRMKLQNGHCNRRRSQCQDDNEVLKFYEYGKASKDTLKT